MWRSIYPATVVNCARLCTVYRVVAGSHGYIWPDRRLQFIHRALYVYLTPLKINNEWLCTRETWKSVPSCCANSWSEMKIFTITALKQMIKATTCPDFFLLLRNNVFTSNVCWHYSHILDFFFMLKDHFWVADVLMCSTVASLLAGIDTRMRADHAGVRAGLSGVCRAAGCEEIFISGKLRETWNHIVASCTAVANNTLQIRQF